MNQPLRVLLDTNGYDYFLDEKEFEKAFQMVETGKMIFYGFKVTRQELRDIPKNATYKDMNFRQLALRTYDRLTKNRIYSLTPIVERLAGQYVETYEGPIEKKEIWNDFLIVACASLHQLDILVSDDQRTMLSPQARKAYEKVNAENQLDMPRMYDIKTFKLLLQA